MRYNPFRTVASLASHPGNKGQVARALIRYARWQVASRLLGQTTVMPWIDDSRLFVSAGEAMVTHNYYTGLYEYLDMIFLLRYLSPEDRFLDVGANSGVYSVLAAKVMNIPGVAYEPIPQTFKRLVANVRLNEIETQVRCENMGLSNRAGVLRFTTGFDATNHVCSTGETDPHAISVPVSTLDEEMRRLEYRPTVMKIDVEGFELPVLEGGAVLLSSPELAVVLIELNDSGARYNWSDLEVSNCLYGHGFIPCEYVQVDNAVRAIAGFKSSRQNTLFVKDLAMVNARVGDFKRHLVHPTGSLA